MFTGRGSEEAAESGSSRKMLIKTRFFVFSPALIGAAGFYAHGDWPPSATFSILLFALYFDQMFIGGTENKFVNSSILEVDFF